MGFGADASRGLGGALRGKFTPAFVQVAVGMEAYLLPVDDHLVLRGGFHLLQVERFDGGDFAFGMFSPFVMATWFPFGVRALRFPISFSAGVEYDVRFTAQASEPYALFSIGYRVAR